MASSPSPPLSETNTESQPHSPPENSRVNPYSLPEGSIPDFDWKALPYKLAYKTPPYDKTSPIYKTISEYIVAGPTFL